MKKTLAMLLALVMVFGLVACGAASPAPAAPTEETAAVETTPAEEETAEPEVPEISGVMSVVATSESYTTLFDKFAEETGVEYELLSKSSGDVLAQIAAENGASEADLWFGGGIDAFMKAETSGYLQQLNFDAASELDSAYIDEHGYWFSKGITIVGFIVNNELLTELGIEAPTSWQDLLKEEYANEIVMSNPAISGTNYAVVNCLLQSMGEEAGWEYFEALNSNIAYYGRRGSDPKNAVIAGEYAIGITYIDRSIDALVNDYDVTVIYPTDGIPWVPEGVAVFAGGPNTAAAEYFMQWLYGNDENLALLAEIDAKNGIKVIKPSLSGVDLSYDTSIMMDVDLSLFGTQRSDILGRFEPLMGDKVVTE